MKYSNERSYRDCLMVEVDRLIKRLDETKNEENFIKKIFLFIKRKIKKLYGKL